MIDFDEYDIVANLLRNRYRNKVKSYDDLEDLIQEVFVWFFEDGHKIWAQDGRPHLKYSEGREDYIKAFFFKAMNYKIKTYYRKETGKKEIPFTDYNDRSNVRGRAANKRFSGNENNVDWLRAGNQIPGRHTEPTQINYIYIKEMLNLLGTVSSRNKKTLLILAEGGSPVDITKDCGCHIRDSLFLIDEARHEFKTKFKKKTGQKTFEHEISGISSKI